MPQAVGECQHCTPVKQAGFPIQFEIQVMWSTVYLQCNEVLLLSVARTVDVRHPVAGVASSVHEVRQPPLQENLQRKEIEFQNPCSEMESTNFDWVTRELEIQSLAVFNF